MPSRAAIVTGSQPWYRTGPSRLDATEGYWTTLERALGGKCSRRPAAERLREGGAEVEACSRQSRQMRDAAAEVVGRHRKGIACLDALVNSAGVGIGATATDHQTKHIDLQLDVNLREGLLLLRVRS